VDGARGGAGAAPGPPPHGPGGRRPLRHQRPKRPLPPPHQPEQPPQEAPRPGRAGDDHPERKADAPGGGGRPHRQRPPRQPGHEPRLRPAASLAHRHPLGQAGALPPEPPGQAGGLLRPLGDRGGAPAQAPPDRAAQADGARALQALPAQEDGGEGHRRQHQGGAADARALPRHQGRGLGRAGGGHPRQGGALKPRPHPPPPRHPGLPPGARRGPVHPAPPARLRGLQRRLRRRPDGGARASFAGRPGGEPDPDALGPQPALPGLRRAHRQAQPGHHPGALLHHPGAPGQEGRGQEVR